MNEERELCLRTFALLEEKASIFNLRQLSITNSELETQIRFMIVALKRDNLKMKEALKTLTNQVEARKQTEIFSCYETSKD